MRRAIVTLCFLLASLAVFPSRADAFFWSWLDDLSGPKFWGVQADWQLWCRTVPKDGVYSLRRDFSALAELQEYEDKLFAPTLSSLTPTGNETSTRERMALLGAQPLVQGAKQAFQMAASALATGDDASSSRLYLRGLDLWSESVDAVADALATLGPELNAVQSSRLRTKELQDHLRKKKHEAEVGARNLSPALLVSLCDNKPGEKVSRYVAFHYGFGWDLKNAIDQNRMVTLGLSLHSVVKPYLTLGVGAGVVSFTGDNAAGFYKPYVQPFIVDVRPFAMIHDRKHQSDPSRQLILIRFDGMVFPSGFEPGQFGGTSPRFKAELVPSLGVHFDVTPYIRKWQDSKRKTRQHHSQ